MIAAAMEIIFVQVEIPFKRFSVRFMTPLRRRDVIDA
jgi:hypothetical protein